MQDGRIITVDPSNGDVLQSYSVHQEEDIRGILEEAHSSFLKWRKSSLENRVQLLEKVAAILLRDKNKFASIIHKEMGKKLEDAISEVEKCAACAKWYAKNAESLLQIELVPTEAKKSFVSFEPLGVVLAIMPWNFPCWQAFRCALPSLLAGNTVLLKHASNVTGCSLAMEEVFREAHPIFPLFRSLLVPGNQALRLIEAREISAVSFTGSTEVGRTIAKAAAAQLKKSVLELGGSDAYVVLEDADIREAAKICAHSRLINAGQSCIAAKRFIIVEKVRTRFEEAFLEAIQSTPLAPLAREDLRRDLQQQVVESISQGAKLLCGGEIPKGKGFYYPATVLTHVKPGITAFDQETFGPVAAIISATDEEDAIRLANHSVFGLGGAVFTSNLQRGEELARTRLEAGSCFVNSFVRSDPRLPFGGIKESGYGRELSSYGLREFVNIKTVWIG